MKNFPFEYNGKEFWYSRSVTTAVCVYCKDNEGVWHALVVKRGKGAKTCVGKWCVPSGYLDFDEDICQCGMRETLEEAGLTIPRVLMNFYAINSIPDTKRQNVNVIYYAVLPGVLDDYELSTENSEPDEIEDVMWIPLSMIFTSDIDLAYNNSNILLDIFNKKIVKNQN